MYIKLDYGSEVIGIDNLGSTCDEVSIFTKNKNSIIAPPSIIDLFSIMSGFFTEDYVENYLNTRYPEDANRIIEWCEKVSRKETIQSLWGASIDTFSKDKFYEKYLVVFGESSVSIDTTIILSKYGFKGILLSNNRNIEMNDIENSIFLSLEHYKKSIVDVLGEYCYGTDVRFLTSNESSFEDDIIIIDDNNSEFTTRELAFSISNYRKIEAICENGPFDFSKIEKSKKISNYLIAFNLQNDVLLTLFNGTVC